jgi:hypothetical protein
MPLGNLAHQRLRSLHFVHDPNLPGHPPLPPWRLSCSCRSPLPAFRLDLRHRRTTVRSRYDGLLIPLARHSYPWAAATRVTHSPQAKAGCRHPALHTRGAKRSGKRSERL